MFLGGGSVLSGSGGRGGGKESVVMFPDLDALRFRNSFLQVSMYMCFNHKYSGTSNKGYSEQTTF